MDSTDQRSLPLSPPGGLGCCPSGHTCSGGQTLTTTVYVPVPVPVAPATTWYPPTVVTSYYIAPAPAPAPATSTVYAPVVVIASTAAATAVWQPATTVWQAATGTVWQPLPVAYCSTLTARGDDLPQARQGWCGTLLVVNAAPEGRPRAGWELLWPGVVAMSVGVGVWRWVGG